jgi:predicted permease
MVQLSWILIWMAMGWALSFLAKTRIGKTGHVLQFTLATLDRFVIWVSLPATILFALHRLKWSSEAWVPVSMAWIVFGGAVLFFCWLGQRKAWSRGTVGALILCCGLGNTSFLGFPLIRAIYGERALSIAVLNDQPGSFLVLSTLGIYCATLFSSRKSTIPALCLRILKFPPIWATFFAFLLKPFSFPSGVDWVLGLGLKTLIPAALISVGSRLDLNPRQIEHERAPLGFGLVYKLVLAPLGMAFVLLLLGKSGETARVTLLEAAMGPMITGAIVAKEYELNPSLCSLLVSFGVPLCLITVPVWAWLLQMLNV